MPKKPIFIIAEAGVNHNGSLVVAKKIIYEAAKAGADAVKFQTFKADSLVTRSAPKAGYQKLTTPKLESQFEMIRKLELAEASHRELIKYCREKGVVFLSSPFDLPSIDLLRRLGLKILKIPSGEITNLPYLRKIGSLNKTIIMSTGMANLNEVSHALGILITSGTNKENITLLHCNTEYPTAMQDVNLRAMLTMKDKLKVKVGYSDHTLGIEVSIAAVALGATVIEKHFTLDTGMMGPDHKASLEPEDFAKMVKGIRNIEKALGSSKKNPSGSELKNIIIARKSIVALRDIRGGERFTKDNITVKRPATGISPMKWDSVLGRTAKVDFKRDEIIKA